MTHAAVPVLYFSLYTYNIMLHNSLRYLSTYPYIPPYNTDVAQCTITLIVMGDAGECDTIIILLVVVVRSFF